MTDRSTTTLRVGTAERVETLNPFRAERAPEFRIIEWAITSGTRRHPITGGTLPWLFEDWTFTGTEAPLVEVTLRDGFTFADGVPVTPSDVAFTVRMYRQHPPKGARSNDLYELVEEIETDPEQGVVRFDLARPDPNLVRRVFGGMLAAHRWREVEDPTDPDRPIEELLVNAGPAVLDRKRPDGYEFELRDGGACAWPTEKHEWLDDGPYVDRVHVHLFDTTEELEAALSAGEVDVPFEGLDRQIQGDFDWIESPASGWTHISFNTRRRPLDDPAFRRALVCLFDDEYAATEAPGADQFERGDYVTPPSYKEWRPPSPAEIDSFEGMTVPTLEFPGRRGQFELGERGVRLVRERLRDDETNYRYAFREREDGPAVDDRVLTVNGEPFGIREPGNPLTILAAPQSESQRDAHLAEQWVATLRAVGIPARVDHRPVDERIDRAYKRHEIDAVMAAWKDVSSLNTHFRQMFSGEGIAPPGEFSYNPMGYTAADEAIERQRETLNPSVRRPAVKRLLVRIWRDAPTLVVGHERPRQPVSDRFEGYVRMHGGVVNVFSLLSVRPTCD